MSKFLWWTLPTGALANEDKGGPWGTPGGGRGTGGGGNNGGGGNGGDGPRNPWSQPPRKRPTGAGANVTSLDDFLKKSRDKLGGGGGGSLPNFGGRPVFAYIAVGLVLLWLAFTSIHRIGPQERGVVTTLGSYSTTLQPGMQFTLPAPISQVETIDVEGIRVIDVGGTSAGAAENLVLTADENIIDLAYSIRWNIADPELYLFQLNDPDSTIREVAESAMREVVANVSLDEAIGARRGQIEQDVARRMQEVLNGYRAGVVIQGIAIRQADPPAAVNTAFKEVSAAKQDAQSYRNQAQAYALQLTAKAQGEAAQFDQIYEQYRLAPEVTRRRMYYETMEQVLSKVDKTIVETGNLTPYLALPEVARRSQPQTTQPSASETPTGTAR